VKAIWVNRSKYFIHVYENRIMKSVKFLLKR
jgi:hypothetical protein